MENINRAESMASDVLGFDGGALREICDISILIPSSPGDYGPVEDMHLMVNHLLAHWFQNKLK